MPTNIIPSILTEKDLDLTIDEIFTDENFEKSGMEIETYESIEDFKYRREYKDGDKIIVDYLNEKELSDIRVQANFKRSRHNIVPNFIISQDYYELPK